MFPESKLLPAALRFEQAHGRKLESFEILQVQDAGLESVEPDSLANQICCVLDTLPRMSPDYRSAAFWALGKLCDSSLLGFFRGHLAREIEDEMGVAYQIMIALNNLGEPVWLVGECSFGVAEVERNRTAAVRYLNECAS